jgi:Uma2 family endonuclease
MTVQERLYTAADLWALSHADEGRRYELDEGALIEMAPTGDRHGVVVAQVTYLIRAYLEIHDLGEVSGAETGYRLSTNPDSVLAPDVGFITTARLQPMTGKYYEVAPDLAVEVVSPNDGARQIRRKADQYLAAGTRLVWVIYPEDRLVDVYQPDHDPHPFKMGDTLDGGDVLPGFTLSVQAIFARLRN